ncbi:protein tyrosine phosphatase 52F [Haematobia irritans]|uniref:protein tyrosine phosphatase 52F n=1 Tax=Haematobia irritans TaxID=7368 RepID=UPI003F506766
MDKFHLRRRWKPPFLSLLLRFLIVIGLLCFVTAEGSGEDITESIEIRVERTPFSLAFSVVDTENFMLQNVTCRNKNNVEIVSNDDNVCENLDPCSTYFSVLTIKNLNSEISPILEKTQDEKTDYAEPSTIITDIENFTESINMTWETEHRSCVLNFQIEAKSADNSQTLRWTVTNENNFLEMEGLHPCQEYTIQLKTYNVSNNLISNSTQAARTEYKEPGNAKLNISEHTNAQTKVSWELESPTTCVNFYYLKWTLLDCNLDDADISDDPLEPVEGRISQCVWFTNLTEPTAKDYIISDLQGCEPYDIELYINNVDIAKTNQTFVSPEKVPGAITINSTDTESTTVNLVWNAPSLNPKCVNYYYVEIKGPDNSSYNISGTDATFDSLQPCGVYNYTIVPQSLNGSRGDAFSNTFNMKEGKPSAVSNQKVKAEPFALDISWDPPTFADLCVTGYRLSGWDDEDNVVTAFDQKTTNTSIRIEGLKACVTYTIQIIPTTASMNDGNFLHIESETQSKASEAPDVDVLGTYPDRFAISARESDKNNKCETIFARIVCEARSDAPIKKAEKYVKGQLVILFNTDIGPLSPYTEYFCSAALYNIGGWSPNKTFVKRTEAYFPDKPENVMVSSRTNHSLHIVWNSPKYPNGNINLYITYFQRVEAAYFIPEDCSVSSPDLKSQEISLLEMSFNELQPYTKYSIQVAAKNEFGISECTSPTMITTKPWISDPVTELRSKPEGPSETELEYKANVLLNWKSPCKSNGDITHFLVHFNGIRPGFDDHIFQRTVEPHFNEKGLITYNEAELKPEYNYSVNVSVKINSVDAYSDHASVSFESPAGIPRSMDNETLERARVEAHQNSNPSKIAVVRFPAEILSSDYGTILYVALLLSQKNCNQEPELKFGAMDTAMNWPNVKSWGEVYGNRNSDCIEQYQTTPVRWKPTDSNSRSTNEIEFVIGTDDCAGTTRICNGPLKPDTEYDLVIRLFTKSGYNDAALLDFRTEALIELTIILAGVSSCLLLAFVAGFVYLWITKRIKWQRESGHGIEDSFGDIASKKFAIFYNDLSKPEKIAREFKELTAVALDLSYSASEMGYNKNRYADIFPYDKNRVILDIDADGSDYINASFIDGYRRRKEYIATQGPKPESATDFWRMVLQHNVRVIVMVTQFREGDVVKCHEYYPFKSKGINVTEKKKDSFDLYDRTELSVVHEMFGLKQKVVHFYFKKWPDHGCPTDPMHLITFVRKVKAEKIPSYSPIVVHCSAGVGRTGTFIGLDIIMQRLKNESKINIYETVKKLRFQRMKMVQSLAQYTFLYTCTYELVKHKDNKGNIRKGIDAQNTSVDSDPETIGTTLRNANQSSRNISDMSSLSNHRQNAVERRVIMEDNSESFM